MSSTKKIKLTDHFKITTKPRDPFRNISNTNLESQLKQQQQQLSKDLKLYPIKEQSQRVQQPQPQKRQPQQQLLSFQPLVQTHEERQQQQRQQLNRHSIQPPSLTSFQNSNQKPLHIQSEQSLHLNQLEQVSTPKRAPFDYVQPSKTINKYTEPPGKKSAVVDFDKSRLSNIFWESHYAWDCFEYDRQQEIKFRAHREALSQLDVNGDRPSPRISPQRWAELVDWLVTIQIRFGLEHEPIFMAVKLADQYLAHNQFVPQSHDVLLFIVTMLISAKFDERVPPLIINDLIKLARVQFGVKYSRKQVISFEIDLLNTLNFHIRFPLSYGFLRRFAMCTRSDIKTIHLARYILESSLMEYKMIEILDSKIAAGSLLLAFRMLHHTGAWNDTAEYYTGYNENELEPLVKELNELITVLSKKRTTIRHKYRNESFKEVAKIPPLLIEFDE